MPVIAEVTADDSENFTTGTVKGLLRALLRLQRLRVATSRIITIIFRQSSFLPLVPDEITINASGIPFDVLADITGQFYDSTTGMLVEKEREPKYFRLWVCDPENGWHKGSCVASERVLSLVFPGVTSRHRMTALMPRARGRFSPWHFYHT